MNIKTIVVQHATLFFFFFFLYSYTHLIFLLYLEARTTYLTYIHALILHYLQRACACRLGRFRFHIVVSSSRVLELVNENTNQSVAYVWGRGYHFRPTAVKYHVQDAVRSQLRDEKKTVNRTFVQLSERVRFRPRLRCSRKSVRR